MLKDINPPKVEDVALAVVKEKNESEETEWNVYLLNLKDHPIEGVLVSSKGYGEYKGEQVKTSMLRHFLDTIPAGSFSKIELIKEKLFGLTNEYWVSFHLNNKMYDKKYLFVAESIVEDHLINIPLINKKGVMIR